MHSSYHAFTNGARPGKVALDTGLQWNICEVFYLDDGSMLGCDLFHASEVPIMKIGVVA